MMKIISDDKISQYKGKEKVNMLEQNRRLDMLWTYDVPFVSLWVTLTNKNIYKAQVIEPDI